MQLNICYKFFLVTFIFFINDIDVFANKYAQPGFYDVEHYVLKNGMSIILKPRHIAKNISIRLKVGVGSFNFKCGKDEIAHYLEHLLFTGTSKHSETELDEIMETNGGSWNAKTTSENTFYEIDIYSKYSGLGLSILHEIITDSQITQDNVDKSLNIINRESGGKISSIRNWLHKNAYIYSAVDRSMMALFSNPSWKCYELDQSTTITRTDIIDAYKNYYTPDNMTLSIVGDFDIASIKKQIKNTFGSIPVMKKPVRNEIPVPEINLHLDENIIYIGRLYPILGTEAQIYQIYRLPDKHDKDTVVFDVLKEYFDNEMYKYLRVEKGVAYSPSAATGMFDKFGFFFLATDSDIDNISSNIKLINQVVAKFKNSVLDEKELAKIKLKILLYEARGAETNSDFADYYVDNDFELKEYGYFSSYVDAIENVTLSDIQRVSKKYFNNDNRVIAVSSPTLTYTQFYIFLFVMILIVGFVSWRLILKFKK